MSLNSINFEFGLLPIASQQDSNYVSATQIESGSDSTEQTWLNNDSMDLLTDFENIKKIQLAKELGVDPEELRQQEEATQQSSNLSIKYQVDQLLVSFDSIGCLLATQTGPVRLTNNDIIAIQTVPYKVTITPIDARSAPNQALDSNAAIDSTTSEITSQIPASATISESTDPFSSLDIWSDNNINTSSSTTELSSLSSLSNTEHNNTYGSAPSIAQDPLDFLYKKPQQEHLSGQVKQQPLPYRNEPSGENYNIEHSIDHSIGSGLHATNNKTSLQDKRLVADQLGQATPGSDSPKQNLYDRITPTNNSMQNNGNILSELGIHEAPSAIITQPHNGNAGTYSESSPMDMLDNFLDSGYGNNHQMDSENFANSIDHKIPVNKIYSLTNPEKKLNLFGGIKNVLKKISI